MKIKKTSAVGIMLAVLAVAGTTTIFATSSPDSKGNEDIPFTSFTSNDGEKQPINESNVVTAKKYSFDGNKLSLEISESESGDADDWTNYIIADADEDGTPVYMFDEDGKKYELPESLKDIAEQFSKMAKTYTDEELDKIIADIEVGKYPEYEYSDDAEVTLIFAD